MREEPLQRMNFLKGGRFAFTYGMMGVVLLAWSFIVFLWYGGIHLRIVYLEKKIVTEQRTLQKLQSEKDRRLSVARLTGKKKLARTTQKELAESFIPPPLWSDALLSLSQLLPRELHFTAIQSDKIPEEEEYTLKIGGEGRRAEAITNFL